MVDLRVVRAAAEHHAHDALAPARAGLRDEHLAVRALVDALDLPHVHLDPRVLDLGDRAAHQLGAQLRVVALALAAHRLQLRGRRGHEQLEQELALALVQPVGELLELRALLAVALRVPVGVVAHEHLREVGVEALDVLAELLPVLEVEHLLARALGGHRQPQALRAGLLGNGRAELLVHQHPRHGRVGAGGHRLLQALEDEVLGVGDHRRLLRVGFALDAEELLLEGAPVVEREDVELLVIAE